VTDNDEPTPATSRKRWIKRVVLGGIAAVVLLFAGIFVYANFINDSPDELDATDLSDALTGTAEPQVSGTTIALTPSDTTPTPDSSPTATAVGRSNEIEGLLTIGGTSAAVVDITVQIENITSDDSTRDGQFRGRIMNASEFPTAEFRVTEPIEFGQLPVGDEQVVATAVGELTLRGVTNQVTLEVTAQTTDGRIGVLGAIPVLFEDYGIDNPSFGVVATEDNGLVEFVLVSERA